MTQPDLLKYLSAVNPRVVTARFKVKIYSIIPRYVLFLRQYDSLSPKMVIDIVLPFIAIQNAF